jgi:hypothetical protein
LLPFIVAHHLGLEELQAILGVCATIETRGINPMVWKPGRGRVLVAVAPRERLLLRVWIWASSARPLGRDEQSCGLGEGMGATGLRVLTREQLGPS